MSSQRNAPLKHVKAVVQSRTFRFLGTVLQDFLKRLPWVKDKTRFVTSILTSFSVVIVFLKDFEKDLYFVVKYFFFKILDFLTKIFGKVA